MTRLRHALVAGLIAGLPASSAAPDALKRDWPQETCFRYGRDWDEALRRFGRDGVSEGFLEGNGAFLRSGCRAARTLYPETAKDRKLADALAIRVVNEGMSTTFLPYGCPQRSGSS